MSASRNVWTPTVSFGLLFFCLGALAFALSALALAPPAHAADLTVTSNADSGAGTLRRAAAKANANGQPDTIAFELPRGRRTITLTSGRIPFTEARRTTVDGGGVVAVSGNDASRVFDVAAGASLTVRGLTVRDGSAPGGPGAPFADRSGGGIRNLGTLAVVGSSVKNSLAEQQGGGIYNGQGGTLLVTNSTLSGNEARLGGGVSVDSGDATIQRSTVSGNSASSGGGGIASNTDLQQDTTIVTNSTVSGNSAAEEGGGVYVSNGLTIVENATVADNTAPAGQGAGILSSGNDRTSVEISSSIVAANDSTDVDVPAGTTSTFAFVSGGYNLVGDGTATGDFASPGDATGVGDPRLRPLADNGGPTRTHALRPTSPAVDRVATDSCPPPEKDQRGVKRPQDGDGTGPARCDSGSFERAAGAPPRTLPDRPDDSE